MFMINLINKVFIIGKFIFKRKSINFQVYNLDKN